MTDIAIRVKNLTKVYHLYDKPVDRLKEALHPKRKSYHYDFYALDDVSFEIKKGETVGIIGKNGAGKSTLLKMITGVLTPTSGEVEVNGKIASLLELGAGFNPEMTGIENIYLNGTIMGFTKEEVDAKVDAILEFADIGEFIHQPVKMYSSGMFARLAFSVAINVEPDVLIVDEALSVGDMLFQQKCLIRMKKMKEKGATILFVSHSLIQVRTLCEQAIYIADGKLLTKGLANVICDQYLNDTTEQANIQKKLSQDININGINYEELQNQSIFVFDEKFEQKISERSGNMELKFVSFGIYENGKLVTDIVHNSLIEIRASFIVQENLPAGSAVGVLVTEANGFPLLGLNSNMYDILLPTLDKGFKGTIIYKFKFPILNVDCIFGIGAKPNPLGNYFYDRIFGCGYLQIRHQDWMQDKNIAGLFYVEDMSIKLVKEKEKIYNDK
jgi:ABC-type polysaccharide/polyol phosphate transport system ATPase subunit